MAVTNDIRAKKLRVDQLNDAIPGQEDRLMKMIQERASLEQTILKVKAHEAKKGNG
jgi:translation initiation factor 2B subunit (eIF-2B alpha/beta/delta family)